MAVKSTLFEYWKDKEKEWGRVISVAEVARQTKSSRDTITRLRGGDTNRFDGEILDRLCKFFKLPAGPVPFIVYEPDPE